MTTQTGRPGKRVAALALLTVCTVASGCQNRDAEHLAEFGARLAEQARALLSPNGRPIRGLDAVPLRIGELALDARVSARLKWDKELAETALQVTSVGDSVVELTGKVRDVEQRRRALELAQTTVGVEKVLDKLDLGN